MPTIILCGGQGTRLKEETEYRPKPMIEVGGKPILWHIMKNYDHHGFNRFILALGYKGNFIKDFFLSQQAYVTNFTLHTKTGKKSIHSSYNEDDFRITFVDTGQNTLTGGRVARLRDYIDTDLFMITYGDGLANVNVRKLLEFHLAQGTIGTITGVNPTSRFGLVNVDKNGIVQGFEQKPKLHDFVNGGYMVFNKEFFDYLNEDDMIEYGFLRLVEKGQLSLYPHSDFWFAVDTIRDVEEANKMWYEGGAPWADWKNKCSDGRNASGLLRETSGNEFLKNLNAK
ncbi:NTP transferase domain-containing protein [Candidatus Peregrinibacteria bacterium]|nr:NTP transferase domain-containing protein [Candidatus Peregrinibacteria bacterium]